MRFEYIMAYLEIRLSGARTSWCIRVAKWRIGRGMCERLEFPSRRLREHVSHVKGVCGSDNLPRSNLYMCSGDSVRCDSHDNSFSRKKILLYLK